jgi:hypothetical protein
MEAGQGQNWGCSAKGKEVLFYSFNKGKNVGWNHLLASCGFLPYLRLCQASDENRFTA